MSFNDLIQVASKTFQEKSTQVLLIDANSANRQVLSDALKAAGFENITSAGSAADAIELLEVDPIGWIVTGLFSAEPVTAMHLLDICTQIPQLKETRTTLMLEKEETVHLPQAYELGLFSWFELPFTNDSIGEIIGTTLSDLEANEWCDIFSAADGVRTLLTEAKKTDELLEFEQNMLDFFPGHPKVALKYAAAKILSGDKEEGAALLRQAKTLDPSMAADVDAVATELLGEKGLESEGDNPPNMLGIENCVLIDNDETVCQGTEKFLNDLGVPNITSFSDGKAAFEHLSKAEEPGLIIMEWKIPGISGPALIQRIKQHGFNNVPIVIQSSLLEIADLHFIKEMGVANILTKPCPVEDFNKGIITTIQQDRRPTNVKSVEAKIRKLLSNGKLPEAEKLAQDFMTDKLAPHANKLEIKAEMAYLKKNYVKAKECSLEAVRHKGDTIHGLNLLGKSLMQTGEHEAALKCLSKAQSLSPQNIDRLCDISNTQLEVGKEKEAEASLEAAKDVDEDNTKVAETEAGQEIQKGNPKKAQALMQKMKTVTGIVSQMNNKAVALARTDNFDESFKLYADAIEAIPGNHKRTKASVLYNSAMAYLRRGDGEDLDEAKKYLEQAVKIDDPKIKPKAKSLLQRLEKAVKSGQSFALSTAPEPTQPQPPPSENEDGEPVEDAVDEASQEVEKAKSGDICCYMFFKAPNNMKKDSGKMLENPPRFTFRAAIERDETGGADKNFAKD